MTERRLLLTRDVAKLLRVHPKQVYRLLARGLPAHRVGSEWRFVEAEVRAWAGEATRPSAPDTPTHDAPQLAPRPPAPPSLLAANGDVIVDLLLDGLRAKGTLVGFVQADKTTALDALERREVLFAAYHGGPPPRALASVRLARLHLVTREVGLASRNRLLSLQGLAKARLASRPSSAGVRGHLDRALAAAKLTRERLGTIESVHASHRDAVLAVHRGEADVALTTRAWAERAGLAFFRLTVEPYELLLFAEDLGTAAAIDRRASRRPRGSHSRRDGRAGGVTICSGGRLEGQPDGFSRGKPDGSARRACVGEEAEPRFAPKPAGVVSESVVSAGFRFYAEGRSFQRMPSPHLAPP